ncbi:hypothetical protein H0A36_23065 [Endozoicomonas sp. SM1973]|uniref:HEPN domain-containing protein n=1 Tax=Spartinivicinus marinus TaxID=2994442 RepID=A0A853IFV0_9GAMM|nr:hypothetical protein [Spartinivicinus marinus]MCX4027527.1 hypothetical protein [Spartinivicinus marinus]NYZ68904.1 hypothetical protein [Spartinivicinus marinus]
MHTSLTKAELDRALIKATEMWEKSDDSDYLAKSLLYHNQLVKELDAVYKAAKLYLHSGNGAKEHTKLIRAIDKVEQIEPIKKW